MSKKDNQAVTMAAQGASKALERFEGTEMFAQKLLHHGRSHAVGAIFGNGNLHIVMSDGKATLEISNGQAAVAVSES
jgi:hypothetical protein